jgi:hypothetical protein
MVSGNVIHLGNAWSCPGVQQLDTKTQEFGSFGCHGFGVIPQVVLHSTQGNEPPLTKQHISAVFFSMLLVG